MSLKNKLKELGFTKKESTILTQKYKKEIKTHLRNIKNKELINFSLSLLDNKKNNIENEEEFRKSVQDFFKNSGREDSIFYLNFDQKTPNNSFCAGNIDCETNDNLCSNITKETNDSLTKEHNIINIIIEDFLQDYVETQEVELKLFDNKTKDLIGNVDKIVLFGENKNLINFLENEFGVSKNEYEFLNFNNQEDIDFCVDKIYNSLSFFVASFDTNKSNYQNSQILMNDYYFNIHKNRINKTNSYIQEFNKYLLINLDNNTYIYND